MQPEQDHYDVVVIGGAFSGAATALLLRRDMPSLRILIIEKRTQFDAKVGEATTEMSAMFLTRRLALWQHLERNHLPKEGLRYWSANEKVTGHANSSETGGFLRSAIPSFQLRRDVLDEHILSLAVAEGAELARPATVREVAIKDFDSTLTYATKSEAGEEMRTVRAKWVLDASGRQHFLGRRLGLIDWNDEHPIASIWSRWSGVRHIDDIAARQSGRLAAGNIGSRRLATNHYVGHGYWIWVIPLGNGLTSIGVVFDKRIHQLHEAKDRAETYTRFLRQHPALAELLEGASADLDDLRSLSRVAYVSRQFAGPGWALLGDAAAFIDPYYSPGLDHCAFCAEATSRIVLQHAAGASTDVISRKLRAHNREFLHSYRWFFRCVYRDKYFYFGEHDLISAAFLLDTSLYYVFNIMPAYRFARKFLPNPVLGSWGAFPFYILLKLSKWRFIRLAALRRKSGEAGRRNDRRRIKAFFNLNLAPFHMFCRGLKHWIYAELDGVRLKAKLLFTRPAVENTEKDFSVAAVSPRSASSPI